MTAIAGAVAVTGAAFMAFFATVRDQVVTGIDGRPGTDGLLETNGPVTIDVPALPAPPGTDVPAPDVALDEP